MSWEPGTKANYLRQGGAVEVVKQIRDVAEVFEEPVYLVRDLRDESTFPVPESDLQYNEASR